MARKTYTREFKRQALRMLSDQGLSVAHDRANSILKLADQAS